MTFTIQETKKITEPSGRIRKYCVCICVCGKEFTRRLDYLQKKKTHIVSCGCLNPKNNKGSKSSTWKGVGDLSAQYYGMIKNRAKKKNIVFDVSKEFLWDLFEKQKRTCALSGLPLNLSHSKRCEDEQTASLDRIDSSKGYTKENVQWVHKDVNLMKNTLQESHFLELCEAIYKHSL